MSDKKPTDGEVDRALYDIAMHVDNLPPGPDKETATEQIKSLALIIAKAQLKRKTS